MRSASAMGNCRRGRGFLCRSLVWLGLVLLGGVTWAQTCLSGADIEPAVRAALEDVAKRYFDLSARGDTAALQKSSIPPVASNFGGVENAVKENQPNFAGASVTVRAPFLLNAGGTEPLTRAEFLCGVFGPSGQTTQSAVFVLNNLPPGKYAVAILDVRGKEPWTLTVVMQEAGGDWKLAGYYARPSEAAGHDGAWFIDKAREFKKKAQLHNAWLYYREAIALGSPVDFMSTLASDKLYDEAQAAEPSDMPANGNVVELNAGGKTYRWTEIFPLAVGNDLDVVAKYASSDVSNTQKTFADNVQMIKALVAKFPELREAFTAVVARAVTSSGQDYGSMLPMKEIK